MNDDREFGKMSFFLMQASNGTTSATEKGGIIISRKLCVCIFLVLITLYGCTTSETTIQSPSLKLVQPSRTATSTRKPPSPTPALTSTATEIPEPLWMNSLRIITNDESGGIIFWQSGTEKMLVEGYHPDFTISDDGSLVAFTHENNLEAIDVESMDRRILVRGVSRIEQFTWIPGTRELLYNTQSALPGENDGMEVRQVFKARYDPPGWSALVPLGKGGIYIISPDGKKALFYWHDIFVIFNLSENTYREISDQFVRYEYAWAQDSQSIFVAAQEKNLTSDEDPMFILEYQLESLRPVIISEFTQKYKISFSPDLTKIVLMNPDNSLRPYDEIFTANIDGSQLSRYQNSAMMAGWAPDSEHFLMIWTKDYFLGEIGKKPIPLAHNLDRYRTHLQWADQEYYFYCTSDDTLYLASIYRPSNPIFIMETRSCIYDFSD